MQLILFSPQRIPCIYERWKYIELMQWLGILASEITFAFLEDNLTLLSYLSLKPISLFG